jgi:pimeloyl-ACP methyl ester carboxylesterase
VSTNNINLEYYQVKNGGINIVFLNGFRMPYKTWDKVYPELASEYSVLLFNRRGVGHHQKQTNIKMEKKL